MPAEPSLRQQLVEARANIREQLYRLRNPVTKGGGCQPPDNRGLIAELSGQLREINAILDGEETPNA